jgi:4-hydroxy-L-threonine phosphate dehydrogenase PdxA
MAGESGHIGREEIDVIEPVCARLRAQGMFAAWAAARGHIVYTPVFWTKQMQ